MSSPSRVQSFFLELAMVILFFSLAAAVVIRFFAAGSQLSNCSRDVNGAILAAQTAAEAVAASPEIQENSTVYYDSQWNRTDSPDAFRLEVSANSELPGAGTLCHYSIIVTAEGDEKPLFELDTAKYWPEEGDAS